MKLAKYVINSGNRFKLKKSSEEVKLKDFTRSSLTFESKNLGEMLVVGHSIIEPACKNFIALVCVEYSSSNEANMIVYRGFRKIFIYSIMYAYATLSHKRIATDVHYFCKKIKCSINDFLNPCLHRRK